MKPALSMSLLVSAGFAGGLALGLALRATTPAPASIQVGGSAPRAERNLSDRDLRPAAKGASRTVIQAEVRQGMPPAPPLSEAPRPDWTTLWTLEPLTPNDPVCLHPTLHVATTLRLEDRQVVADSIGWAECEGQPLRVGEALQVEQRRILALPPAPSFPWRGSLLWAPPQQGRAAQMGLGLQRDLGRMNLQLLAFPDRVAVGFGFSWGNQ